MGEKIIAPKHFASGTATARLVLSFALTILSPVSVSGCCSQNFKDCITWCGTTESECLSCNKNVVWINGPQSGCTPRYDACTYNVNACCKGLSCVGGEFYRQCKYIATESPSKSPAEHPSERPTKSPTPSPTSPPTLPMPRGCSDYNRKECKDGSSKCIWNKGERKMNTCSVGRKKYADDCSDYRKRKCKNYCEWEGGVCIHKCNMKCNMENEELCKYTVDKKGRQICKFKLKKNPIYKTCLDKLTKTPTQIPFRN